MKCTYLVAFKIMGLTVLDFFKEKIYSNIPRIYSYLKHDVDEIHPEMCRNIVDSFPEK